MESPPSNYDGLYAPGVGQRDRFSLRRHGAPATALRQWILQNLHQQIQLRRRLDQGDQVRQRIVVAGELEGGRLDAGALALVLEPRGRVLHLDEADARVHAEGLAILEQTVDEERRVVFLLVG